MTTPVAYSLVGSILQRHVARCYGAYGSSQHLHSFYVNVLAFYIGLAHVNYALHVHQRTYGSGSHAMLSCTGLGYDTLLAHASCQQNLTYGVVNLMRSGMI